VVPWVVVSDLRWLLGFLLGFPPLPLGAP